MQNSVFARQFHCCNEENLRVLNVFDLN